MADEKKQGEMTPEWSQQLAVVAQSPIWHSLDGMARKAAFVEAASAYASYADLPPRLKASYQKAVRQLPRRRHARGRH